MLKYLLHLENTLSFYVNFLYPRGWGRGGSRIWLYDGYDFCL